MTVIESAWESVKVYGSQWNVYGSQWERTRASECALESVRAYGSHWECMGDRDQTRARVWSLFDSYSWFAGLRHVLQTVYDLKISKFPLTGYFLDGQVRVRGLATDYQNRNLVTDQRESQASYSSFGEASGQVILNLKLSRCIYFYFAVSLLLTFSGLFSSKRPYSRLQIITD